MLNRKHSYAPEEQKHARLYAVRGISRNGHEFPVEVNVTSFVIDGEIFFTGVITEVTPRNTRAGSVSSSFSEMSHESSLKQRVSSNNVILASVAIIIVRSLLATTWTKASNVSIVSKI